MFSFKGITDESQMITETLPSFHDYICILQKGTKDKDIVCAKRLHTYFHAVGLESHQSIGSNLLRLFVDCGRIDRAQQVFNKLIDPSQYCWTSLIQGYTKSGEYAHAIELFRCMQEDHSNPTTYTIEALLKATAGLQCLDTSLELHYEIVKEGFEKDFFIGSSLVDLYVKCGLLEEAQIVFDELDDHDVIVWNFLIAGYSKQGLDIQSLILFDQMQSEGVLPDAVTFVCVLKACCSLGVTERGQTVHVDIIKEGFEANLQVGNTLIDMYAKSGSFEEALGVIEEMPVQDVITWSALIAGYAEHGHGEEALNCFRQMQLKGVHPNPVTFSSGLKACSSMEAVRMGLEIHAEIVVEEYVCDLFVSSNLLGFYSTCGMFDEAWEIFDNCESQDMVLWNALISGYAKHGLNEEVLDCFDNLHTKGMHPDAITFVLCLKSCGSIPALKRGQEIHAEIVRKGFEGDSFVGNSLVDMYGRCDSLSDAEEVFAKLPVRDIVSWNTLIAGYVEQKLYEEALKCFQQMRVEAIPPSPVTFLRILKACGRIGATDLGQGIHTEVAKRSLESDPCIVGALTEFYADSGNPLEALKVFDRVKAEDAGLWNTFVRRYLESGWGEAAVTSSLEQMQLEGVSVGLITALCSLKDCIGIRSIDRGLWLHMKIVKEGLERDSFVANLLLDMYTQCGFLEEAQKVFNEFLPIWSVAEWNILIEGYVKLGESEKADTLFAQMQQQGLVPITTSFLSLLKSCVNILALEAGKRLHAQIVRPCRHKPMHEVVATNLIDMYGKCGSRADAEEVFETMCKRDLVGWSALVGVYVSRGESELVFSSFEQLRAEGVMPDAILFVSILTACSHGGFVLNGQEFFETMGMEYAIIPIIEHYNCMIDLLGRVGQLGEAVSLFENMPFEPDIITWSSVLGACRNWGRVDLGRRIFYQALKSNVKYDDVCTLMCNICADFYTREEMEKIKVVRVFDMMGKDES